MTDRVELKRSARERLRSAQPSAFLVALVFLLVSLAFDFFAQKVPLLQVDLWGMQQAMEEISDDPGLLEDAEAFRVWYANALKQNTARAGKADLVINAVLWAARIIWAAGFTIYSLRVMRQGSAEWGSLLDGFAVAWKLLVIELLTGVLTYLGCMLFFFPGLMISYSLRQSIYVLLDHPDWSVFRCMGESRALMRGHRWELFVLDMSFLGWIMLCVIPVTMIYVEPYMNFTQAAYYNALLAEQSGAGQRWDGPDGRKPPWEY